MCINYAPTCRNKDEGKRLILVKRSIHTFFIEVISSVCFGQSSLPENKLIEMLLDIVFKKKEMQGDEGSEWEITRLQTSDLTPFKVRDEKPTIRSFLLQLLLNHEYNILCTKCINCC